jgi:polyisoprenoid-binding protein YceI
MVKNILAILACLPILAFAAVPTWKIDPAESTLAFTATQNNAPVTGQFKKFSGTIQFDPTQLTKSQIAITIDTAAIESTYDQVADTLKTADWFNTAVYPHAEFKADHFKKIDSTNYTAEGTLTIRNQSAPVTLTFSLPEYSSTKAVAKGHATVQRTLFGVGQGDWSKTDTIKDSVAIEFTIVGHRS